MNRSELDALLNQIKNIILNKPISDDLKSESEEIADVQEAIYYLSNCLSESNEFLKQLSIGNLDAKTPSRHNFFAGSLKELHSGLKHLTWQANQVARGDYNQQVSFLGDFSVSFNKMIVQLSERELKLKQQSSVLTETNNLMMSIMDGLKDWIIVTARETGEIIYTNQSAKQLFYDHNTEHYICGQTCELMNYLKQYKDKNMEDTIFDYSCPLSNKDFRVRTYLIQWNENLAYVHYILDVTYEKEEREQIEELVYRDELTNLYNRRYCIGQLDYLLTHKANFSFCMIDLDGLKFANDTFGHAAGDEYLQIVAREMLSTSRNTDVVCRLGGDEFAIICPSCAAQIVAEKMNCLNLKLSTMQQPYPLSISYGVVYVDKGEKLLSETIMAQVDEKMYIQKRLKKKRE
ncbi:MAG: diguanylate cyclase [Longicatena sp.]